MGWDSLAIIGMRGACVTIAVLLLGVLPARLDAQNSEQETLTKGANSSDGGAPGRLTPYRWTWDDLHKDISSVAYYFTPEIKEVPPHLRADMFAKYCHYVHKLDPQIEQKKAARAYRVIMNTEIVNVMLKCPPTIFVPKVGWVVTSHYIIYKYPAYSMELSRMLYFTKRREKEDKARAREVAKELVDLQIQTHEDIMKNAIEFTDKGTQKLWAYAGIAGQAAPEERENLTVNLKKVKKLLEKDLKPLITEGKLEEGYMAIFQRMKLMIPRLFSVSGIHDNGGGENKYKKQSHLPHFTPINFATFAPFEYTRSYLSDEDGQMKSMTNTDQSGFLALVDRMGFPEDFNQRGLKKIIEEGNDVFPVGAVRGAWDGRTADNTFKDHKVELKVPEKIQKLMDPNLVKGEGGSYSPGRLETELEFKDQKTVGIRPYTIEDSDKLPRVVGGDEGFIAGPKKEEDAVLGSGSMGVPGLPTGPYPSNRLLTGLAEGLRFFSSPKAGPEITESKRRGGATDVDHWFTPLVMAPRWWMPVIRAPRKPRQIIVNDDTENKRPSFHPALDGVMPNFTQFNQVFMKTNDRERALKDDMKKMQQQMVGSNDNPFVYFDRLKASAQDWEKFNRFDQAKRLENKKGSEFTKEDLKKVQEEERLQELISLMIFKTYAGAIGYPGYGKVDWEGGVDGGLSFHEDAYPKAQQDVQTLKEHAGSYIVAR